MVRATTSALRAAMAVGIAASIHGAVAAAEDTPVQTQTVSGKAYDGDLLSGSSWPAALYSIKLVTEKGPGLDRLSSVSIDPHGRSFFSQTVDFDGDSPKAYTFSNAALGQAGKPLGRGPERASPHRWMGMSFKKSHPSRF